jgi:hypothetical protein
VQVWGERTGGTKDALALDGEQPLASKVTGMVGEGKADERKCSIINEEDL